MRRKLLLAVLLLLAPVATLAQQQVTGRVVHVADGDTITVQPATGPPITARLFGVDCPEGDQPSGAQAADFTRRRVDGAGAETGASPQGGPTSRPSPQRAGGCRAWS